MIFRSCRGEATWVTVMRGLTIFYFCLGFFFPWWCDHDGGVKDDIRQYDVRRNRRRRLECYNNVPGLCHRHGNNNGGWKAKSSSVRAGSPSTKATTITTSASSTTTNHLVETNNKPKLVFHIGPPKTATTTVQHLLTYNYTDTLEMDHWIFVPRHGIVKGVAVQAFSSNKTCQTSPTVSCFDALKEILLTSFTFPKAARYHNKTITFSDYNLLLSFEGFIKIFSTRQHYQALRDAFSEHWGRFYPSRLSTSL